MTRLAESLPTVAAPTLTIPPFGSARTLTWLTAGLMAAVSEPFIVAVYLVGATSLYRAIRHHSV